MKLSRQTIAYGHDIVMAALSVPAALWLRMGADIGMVPADRIALWTVAFTLIGAVVFRIAGLYRGVWRYASVNDLLQIARSATVLSLVFLPVVFLIDRAAFLPRSWPFINWLVLVTLLGGPRFVCRMLKDRQSGWSARPVADDAVPVMLLGAGDDAETFIRAMDREKPPPYRVVGLLDDTGRRVGRDIRQIPVLGGPDDLETVLRDLNRSGKGPQRLIIARTGLPASLAGDLVERAGRLGLPLSRLPRLTDFRAGTAPMALRPLAIEDLLRRPQAAPDRTGVAEMIAGRRVLVTGAGGTIGSELVRQIAALAPARLILLEQSEHGLYEIRRKLAIRGVVACLADVRDRAAMTRIFSREQPELVFHAAALKHVPVVEAQPADGVLTNVIGSRHVAEAARASGAQTMVLISTDKAVNPTSVMGATKRAAESFCQSLDKAAGDRATGDRAAGDKVNGATGGTRFVTVRFGNVLGSTGSVVPLFREQLAAGGPLTVTHPEMTRYFMTCREAVELVLQAARLGAAAGPGLIHVLDMGEPVRIVDLARQMIRLAGKDPERDIRIVFTGMRPGERLNEQLFHESETLRPTSLEAIRLAAPRTSDLPLLLRAFERLEAAARAGDGPACRDLLHHLVPEYNRDRRGTAVDRTPPSPSAAGHQNSRQNSGEKP